MVHRSLIIKLLVGFFGLIVLFILFLPFTIDYKHCSREFSFTDCLLKYFRYNFDELFGKCYVEYEGQKGISNGTYILLLDFYLGNVENFSERNITQLVENVNKIWNNYGIYFKINSISRVNISVIYTDKLKNVTKSALKDKLYDKIIDVVIIEKFLEKGKFLLWDYEYESSREGVGFKGMNKKEVNLVLLTVKGKNISWNLAHEIGHLLGLVDKAYYSGILNLMTHSGCIKEKFYPTILNQKQVNIALMYARNLKNSL